MPTSPREPSFPSSNDPHTARQVAESFGVDPERYDRARPRYPDALVERIVAASPGPDVLDVGCGTGIAARQFRAAGCTVLGVDPDARMAGHARRTGIEVEVATFESWDPAGRTFDTVIAAQAWHWVDPVAGAAKAARVLRPGGLLAIFAHVFDLPPAVGEAFTSAYRRVVPDAPVTLPPPGQAMDIAARLFDRFAEGIRRAGAFGEPQRWRFDREQTHTRDELLDLLPTTGLLTRLPADRLAQVLAEVGAAIDTLGGAVTMPYRTVALVAKRTGDS